MNEPGYPIPYATGLVTGNTLGYATRTMSATSYTIWPTISITFSFEYLSMGQSLGSIQLFFHFYDNTVEFFLNIRPMSDHLLNLIHDGQHIFWIFQYDSHCSVILKQQSLFFFQGILDTYVSRFSIRSSQTYLICRSFLKNYPVHLLLQWVLMVREHTMGN